MSTLITQKTGSGGQLRCDAKCHDALGPDCDCICGGINHGVGAKQALKNTHERGLEFLAEGKEVHMSKEIVDSFRKETQTSLFR